MLTVLFFMLFFFYRKTTDWDGPSPLAAYVCIKCSIGPILARCGGVWQWWNSHRTCDVLDGHSTFVLREWRVALYIRGFPLEWKMCVCVCVCVCVCMWRWMVPNLCSRNWPTYPTKPSVLLRVVSLGFYLWLSLKMIVVDGLWRAQKLNEIKGKKYTSSQCRQVLKLCPRD